MPEPLSGNGMDITADIHDTFALALSDVNHDLVPDLLVGNLDQVNRLYLNTGMDPPFVTGYDITPDAHSTRTLLAVDAGDDGDPDVVTGNFDQAVKIVRNDRRPEPVPKCAWKAAPSMKIPIA